MTEMRTLPAPETIKAADDGSPKFSGYGAVFGNRDDGLDVIEKGAFKKFRKVTRGRQKGKIKILAHHSSQAIVGYADVTQDGKGLFVKGELNLDYEGAEDIHRKMLDGGVDCMSAGFNILPKGIEYDEEQGAYMISKAELWEVSLVTFGMNREARLTSVKSAANIHTLRDFESMLREQGYSKKQAAAIACHGYKAMEQGEPVIAAGGSLVDINTSIADFLKSR